MNFPNLAGSRIKLIDLSESYIRDMFKYSKNPLLYRYFEFPPQKTIEETRAYLRNLMRRSNVETAHYWFIQLIETKKVIGSFGVHDIDWRKKNGEISYGLSPEYWGQGLFNETLTVVLNYLFAEQGFRRIAAVTRLDNDPSIKSLERIGFKREGVLRDFYLSHTGQRYDAAISAVLKSDYEVKTV